MQQSEEDHAREDDRDFRRLEMEKKSQWHYSYGLEQIEYLMDRLESGEDTFPDKVYRPVDPLTGEVY